MDFLILNLFNFAVEMPSIIPFGEYLEIPWNWYLGQQTWIQICVVVFGALGFYLGLRLFYKIVESIVSIFQ